MKRLETFKTIQLIVYIGIAILCFVLVVFNPGIFSTISDTPGSRLVTALLWIVIAVGFFFIFLDFTFYAKQAKDIDSLSTSVKTDPMTNIANRLSCDEVIEKYLDQPLPKDFACVTFALSNIQEINKEYGHVKGNQIIKKFSLILKMASIGHCFVGRNGGNQFLALLENGSDEVLDSFLKRVAQKVKEYNSTPGAIPLKFTYGVAFHEDPEKANDITSLIALSSRRAAAVKTSEAAHGNS